MKCCICGEEIEGIGNNPDGARWKNPDGSVETPKFSEKKDVVMNVIGNLLFQED